MTLSPSRVSSRSGFLLGAVAAALFALTPQIALAQHGGGGGGHAGGGGGHFGGGGGGHFGGSSGGSHASAAKPASTSHSSSKPPATFRPPSAPATQASVHNGASDNFGAGSRPLSFSGTPSGPAALSDAATPHTTIGFPPSSGADVGHSQLLVHGGVLSFSGQGHDIWQNPPNALAGARPFANAIPAYPRMFPPVRRPPIFFPGYGGYGTGFIYNPFLFGFGFGFGLNCNPFFWDQWDAWNTGCNSLGYWGPYSGGYYGAGAYLGASGYGGADAGSDTSQGYSQYAPQNSAPDNSEGVTTTVVMLYLNDGTSFAVTDYWVADYKLHYVAEGREGALDLDQIDVQRTVDMNASRGVTFSLKPAPAAAPSPQPAAPQQ
jgi:hypothetical protein